MITRIFNFLCVYYVGVSQAEALKEENDSLRCQLDAYRNEVELLRKEQSRASRPEDDHSHTHPHSPEAQIQLLQQSMHSMQQVCLSACTSHFHGSQK